MSIDVSLLRFYLKQRGIDLQIQHATSSLGNLVVKMFQFLAQVRL
jgi:hypothetical protein